MEQMVKRMEQTVQQSMQHAVASQMCHMSATIDAKLKRIANEGQRRSERTHEKVAAIETRLENLENAAIEKKKKVESSEMNEKARRTADENKAVVTGFKEDDDETEVRILLEKSIDVSGMKKAEIVIKCPAKPITHAFLEFKDNDQRDS